MLSFPPLFFKINCDNKKEIKPDTVQFAAQTLANFFKCRH